MNILEAFKKLEQGEKVRPVEWGKKIMKEVKCIFIIAMEK